MNEPLCTVHEFSSKYPRKVVRGLRFDGESLAIDIQGDGFAFATLTFRRVYGFRVLDERDLCEFWPRHSEPNGWLYEVLRGGWIELESGRELFNSPSFVGGLREFFVVDDMCISVMTTELPEVEDRGGEWQSES